MASEINIKKAYDFINNVDIWDATLWNLYQEIDAENTFSGNAKDINTAFRIGLNLAINEPTKFKIWNEGFIAGCSWGVDTLADFLVEAIDDHKSNRDNDYLNED
mgnify:CR=1 FL=1